MLGIQQLVAGGGFNLNNMGGGGDNDENAQDGDGQGENGDDSIKGPWTVSLVKAMTRVKPREPYQSHECNELALRSPDL